jgi:hypothetical protein
VLRQSAFIGVHPRLKVPVLILDFGFWILDSNSSASLRVLGGEKSAALNPAAEDRRPPTLRRSRIFAFFAFFRGRSDFGFLSHPCASGKSVVENAFAISTQISRFLRFFAAILGKIGKWN